MVIFVGSYGIMFLWFGYAGYYGIVEKDFLFRNQNRTEKTKEKFAVVSGYFFLMSAIVGLTCCVAFAISENVTIFFRHEFCVDFCPAGILGCQHGYGKN